jgi:hypothetical protein
MYSMFIRMTSSESPDVDWITRKRSPFFQVELLHPGCRYTGIVYGPLANGVDHDCLRVRARIPTIGKRLQSTNWLNSILLPLPSGCCADLENSMFRVMIWAACVFLVLLSQSTLKRGIGAMNTLVRSNVLSLMPFGVKKLWPSIGRTTKIINDISRLAWRWNMPVYASLFADYFLAIPWSVLYGRRMSMDMSTVRRSHHLFSFSWVDVINMSGHRSIVYGWNWVGSDYA